MRSFVAFASLPFAALLSAACDVAEEAMRIDDATGTCRQEWRCGAKK